MSILLVLVGLQFAQPKCMDFTGHYMISGEDGTVDVRIAQSQCARVDITWESSLERRKPVVHTVPLDGIARADTSWFGAERIQSAGTIVASKLEFRLTDGVGPGQRAVHQSLTLEMMSNGDLCVGVQDTGRTQTPDVAKRATPRRTPLEGTALRPVAACV